MFTALTNNDKVGLLLFADDIVRYIPPRKGRGSVLRLVRELLSVEPIKASTNISAALQYIGRVQRRKCIVFLLSDFLGPDFSQALSIANQKHDCVAVTITDPREESLPNVGFVTLKDAETDELLEIDTSNSRVRNWFELRAKGREAMLAERLRKAGVDRLEIRTDRPYASSLQRFFHQRERKR
jgi:uncharacterized protein (DUF58 family)